MDVGCGQKFAATCLDPAFTSAGLTLRAMAVAKAVIAFNDGQVTFRWRDSAHNNQQKLMTLSLDEFLRRFLLHLLPKGFVRIRHFGFLASCRRTQLLPLCLAALDSAAVQTETATSTAQDANPDWVCPKGGGPMVVIERLTAAQIQLRSPPATLMAAA